LIEFYEISQRISKKKKKVINDTFIIVGLLKSQFTS